MTQTQTGNLFAKAKKVEPKSTKKTTPEILFTENEFPGIDKAVKSLKSTKATLATLKTESETWHDEVKDAGVKKFIQLYQEKGARPGSFVIKTESGAHVTFMPKDAYTGLSVEPEELDNTIERLQSKWGENVIATTTEYGFNQELLAKHMAAISEAIAGCPDIPQADKDNLFTVKEKHVIAPQSIDRYMQFEAGSRDEFMSDIAPIFSIR